jgi:hypothetical protein
MFNTDDFSKRYRDPSGAEHVAPERRARFKRHLDELQERGPALGFDLLELFETLPQALQSSQQVEHRRLLKCHGDKHPRVLEAALELEELGALELQASAGRARARRLIEQVGVKGPAFHGFVTDTSGQPLPGIRIEVRALREQLIAEANTADDGYFRAPLPATERVKPVGEKFAEPGASPAAAPKDASGLQTQVLLRDRGGRLLYEDPLPLVLDGSSAYRDYQISRPDDACGVQPTQPVPVPAAPPARTSTPLEHVRGIGPKRAERLRAAGIGDLESLLRADVDHLVEILGFDVGPTRAEAERVLAEHRAGASEGSARTDTALAAAAGDATSAGTAAAAAEPPPASGKMPRGKRDS